MSSLLICIKGVSKASLLYPCTNHAFLLSRSLVANPWSEKYIIEKGSVAIDGISLTVAERGTDFFSVSVIPHTGSETTLLGKREGDVVNLENDVIGKYVEQMLKYGGAGENVKAVSAQKSVITSELLAQNGFI